MAVIHTGFTVKKLSILFKAKLNAMRGSTRQYAMSAKAEIEAQIRALQGKLKDIEIDPEFTPAELVRWRPSLIGTMLHAKPNPALGAVSVCYGNALLVYEQFGLLIPDGMLVARHESWPSNGCSGGGPLAIHGSFGQHDIYAQRPTAEKLILTFQEMINIKQRNHEGTVIDSYISLCKPEEILDKIFVVSSHTLPNPLMATSVRVKRPSHFNPRTPLDDRLRYPSNMLIVIDHYPLSVLYKEWLADKHRGPPVIHPESGAAAIPSPYVLAADIKASRCAKAE